MLKKNNKHNFHNKDEENRIGGLTPSDFANTLLDMHSSARLQNIELNEKLNALNDIKKVTDFYKDGLIANSPIKPVLNSKSKELENEINILKLKKDSTQIYQSFLEDKINNPDPRIEPFIEQKKQILNQSGQKMLSDPQREESDKNKIRSLFNLINKK